MNWTPERILIFGLSVLLLLAGMIILKLYRERKKSDNEGGSHDFVSLNKHKEVLKERDNLRNEIDLLKQRGLSREIDPVYNDLQEKYERACVEIGNVRFFFIIIIRPILPMLEISLSQSWIRLQKIL